VKIYLASVKALREKERQDETQFTIKIGGKNQFGSQLFISLCKIFIPSYVFDALLNIVGGPNMKYRWSYSQSSFHPHMAPI
jgi:hypothetical protein